MSKAAKKQVLWIAIAVVAAAVIGFMPAETEAMSRGAWQYLGLFIAMLIVIITNSVQDWAAGLVCCAMVVVYGIDSFAGSFNQFAGTSGWTLIAIYLLCIGLANSGFMKRLALYLLRLFPRNYRGQAIGFSVISAILCPLIPSTTAKCGLMTPLACEASEMVGLEKNSKGMRGLWGITITAGFYFSCAFISGSAQCAIMAGLAGEGNAPVTWVSWFAACWPYYVVGIIVMALYAVIFCAPKKGEAVELPADFYSNKIKELGPMSLKEKQGAIILAIALIFWLTETIHGIPAVCVALIADVAMLCCGLISKPEVSAKGNWHMVIFVCGLMGFSGYMRSLGVGSVIANIMSPIAPIIGNPWLFIPVLCILVVLLRYVVVSQLCTVAITLAIFGTLGAQFGLSPFIIVFITHQIGGSWNTSYNNPVAMGLLAIVGEERISYKNAQIISYVYCVACLIAFTLSIPVWQNLGMI